MSDRKPNILTENIIGEIPEKEHQAKKFGRWWTFSAGLAMLAGTALIAEGFRRLITEWGFCWPPVILSLVAVALTLVIAFCISSRRIHYSILLIPSFFSAIVVAMLGYTIVTENHYLRNGFFADYISDLLLMLVLFPFIAVVVFGPFASSIVRRVHPQSRFVAYFGAVTGFLWGILILVAGLGYYSAFAHYYSKLQEPSFCGTYFMHQEECIRHLAYFVIGAMPGIAVAVLSLINTFSKTPDRAKKIAKYAIIAGVICFLFHLLIALVVFRSRNPYNQGLYFFFELGTLLFTVGFVILTAITLTQLLLRVTSSERIKHAVDKT